MSENELITPDKELEEMFLAGLQFGYFRSKRQPKMSSYMYGIKNNIEVFDLEKTRDAIRSAENFLRKVGEAKKNVLWIGTKPSAKVAVVRIGQMLSHSYVAARWVGGSLTNAKIIRDRIKYFEDLKKKKEMGELEKYTKKERLKLDREIKALTEKFTGIENLKNDLEAIIIVDPKEEKTAFAEAQKVSAPIVAILSSDNDPTGVDYPIPANDSAPSSIEYILDRLARAYKEGSALSLEKNGE